MSKKPSPKIATAKAKPMAKTTSAKPMAKDTSKAIVSFIDPKALAPKGEGEKIAKQLCASAAQIEELESKLGIARASKGAALSNMTNLFIAAGKADKGINFAIALGEDKKAKEKLFDKLRAVMGIIEVRINPDGTEVKTQAPWANELFPKIGETLKNAKGDPTIQARETNRSNFVARMREAAKAAHGAISKGITAEIDKTTGRLAISGKAVREHFNQDKVILDEKQSFTTADGTEVNLKAKPSITELGRMGGAVVRPRGGGATPPEVNVSNPDAVIERLGKWQETIAKLGQTKLDDKIRTALEELATAIEDALESSAALEAA